MSRRMVIIGAGEAGARAAMALRENGFAGSITLIGAEPHLPYERPPLSKATLLRDDDPTPAFIHTPEKLVEHDITLLCNARATRIDRVSQRVETERGAAVPYDRLLIATGARPRRLTLPGADRVHYLRTFSDALALRRILSPGQRLALIGGGFIGLELAAAARSRGCDVTIIEMAPRLLARAVPEEIAGRVAARHEAEGVRLVLGANITNLTPRDGRMTIRLQNGDDIIADDLIVGIGATPDIALAEAAGLAIENGVRVDEYLATSDTNIFAAGDCCSFPLALYGGRRVRLEAWRNAQDQANHAARAMMGWNTPYDGVPWFWSDQYDSTIQIAGLPDEGAAIVRRDLGEGCIMLFHLAHDGRLVAASAFGPNGRIAKDIRLSEMLIARAFSPKPGQLETTELKKLLRAA